MADQQQHLSSPSGSVLRESSTPRGAENFAQVRLKALRALPYGEYLLTPWWRSRRSQALKEAGWTCARCPSRRELNVHHRSYDRLGEELRSDLEVLCRSCHEGHHHEESRTNHLGIYLKIVSEVLKAETFETLADLTDVVKQRCATLKIGYNSERVARAVDLLNANRNGVLEPWKPIALGFADASPEQPISASEAALICRRLGLLVALRSMPSSRPTSPDIIAEQQQVLLEEAKPTAAWELATEERHCGWCNAVIAAGSSRLVVKSKKWTRERCEPCAARLGLGPKEQAGGRPQEQP